jgi:hypothetical protein
MNTLIHLPPMLAASIDPKVLMAAGALLTIVVTLFTYSNWRLGVKAALVMAIFEGAIRKWAIPSAQELAYFLKDIVLIGAYLRFYMSPDSVVRSWVIKAPMGIITLCCGIVSLSAMNPNIGSWILALYGIKIYMFYIPLAFMMPYLYSNKEEWQQGLFWFAMLALPVCLLGVVQFTFPGDSFWNVTAHGGEGTTMGTTDSKIRVTGTFSYITGFGTFLAIQAGLHMALLVNKIPKWQFLALLVNLPLLAGSGLMSGSRTASISMVAIGAGFLLVSMFQQVGSGKSTFLVVGAAMGIVVLGIGAFFTEAKSQFTGRVANADTDTLAFRVMGMPLKSVEYAMNQGGGFGFGIGMTHPALEQIRKKLQIAKPRDMPPTYDAELGQVLVELGLFGWLSWYFMRLILICTSVTLFFRTEAGLYRAMVLSGILIQILHLFTSLVLNHTANIMVFAGFGLCLIPTLHSTLVQARVATPGVSNARMARSSLVPTRRGSR